MTERTEGPKDYIDWDRLGTDKVFLAGVISDILEKNFQDYRQQKIVAMSKGQPLPSRPQEYEELGRKLHELDTLDLVKDYCRNNTIKKLDFLSEEELKKSAVAFMESLENN